MSMWEIEALIEASIRLVDQTAVKTDKVNLIWNLYEIQGLFDCSFTHFRLMDLLLKNGYTKAIERTAYPNYEQQKRYLEELKENRFAFLYENLAESWSETNPVVAYWDQKTAKVYIDCDSPIWGNNRPILTKMDPYELGKQLILEANRQGQRNLIYDWTAFLLNYGAIYFAENLTVETLIANCFETIAGVFAQHDFSAYKPMHESLEIYWEPQEWFSEEQQQLMEWFKRKISDHK
ncbi:hypothetical protein [Aureispira anguillae]|uniref:Uncharacterized protein n=1 Tax=Aureispira anguillae TaxID=2864201 RepID=A0A916DR40_9BACT|nr:hypothetical protein [Aureispira anguillae]BDS10435.1 hypothetical protein AsAng_0011430 [Aureispira anguillae]